MPSGLFFLISLDRSIFKVRGVWLGFFMTMFQRNLYAIQTAQNAASDLGLHGLPMSILWNARLKRINAVISSCF